MTKEFIAPADIETTLVTYKNIYRLNLYSLNVDNPINVMYYSYNISEINTLQYDPPELTFWQRFSQSKSGKITAGIVFVAALAASIAVWIRQGNSTIFEYLIGGIASSLLVGGIYAGWQVGKRGESFFSGLANYINNNWSLIVAIESIQTIIQCGVSTIAYAIKTRAINKRNAKIENAKVIARQKVEKYGMELFSEGEKGKPRAVSVAVDIQTGDSYQGKSKDCPTDINQALLEQMPDESLTKWTVNNCAEISAVNKALQNGAKMENLVVATLQLDWKTVTFTSFSACSNCRISLSGVLFIVTESNHTI